MNAVLSIAHPNDHRDDHRDSEHDDPQQDQGASAGVVQATSLVLPVVERADRAPQPYSKAEGQLIIDHKVEGIVNAIRDVSIPKESPPIQFKGGLHLSGVFTAGSIDVEGTLVIDEGAKVDVQKVKCKRLYVNRGELHCVSIETGSLVAWDGSITASAEIAYGALEESRYCAISGQMRWVRS